MFGIISKKILFHTTNFTTKDSLVLDVLLVLDPLKKVKILELVDGGGKTLNIKSVVYTLNSILNFKKTY
jgi:hypothetical protein